MAGSLVLALGRVAGALVVSFLLPAAPPPPQTAASVSPAV